jgi:hypothetical protein
MSIKTFSFQEMLTLTDENAATLRNDRRHGHAVAAFGTAEPSNNSKWLLVDCVAMLIRDQLNDEHECGMRRKTAAFIVRAFFDQWAEAVSKVEHLHQAMLFATADHGDKKMWAAFGPTKDFRAFLDLLPEPPKRLYTVDVTAIMARIQQRAQKADIVLGNFFLPPDHPLFIKWTTEFRAAREKAQAQFDPLKKPMRGPSERERQSFEDALCTI